MPVVAAARGGRSAKHSAGGGEEERADDDDEAPVMFDGAPDEVIQRIGLFKQSLTASGVVSWGERHAVLSQSYLTFYEPSDPTGVPSFAMSSA